MKTSVGLDIGSHSIKLIELGVDGGKYALLAAGSIATPANSFSSTVPADIQALADAIKRLLRDTGTKSRAVQIALPESKVFTRVIEVPALSQRELASAIKWEAEQYIPLPLDQVNLDFSVLRDAKETGTNKMEVLLVAAPKTLMERYLSIMELSDLTPTFAETEILATVRALGRGAANVKGMLVISMGAQTTDLAILRSGVLSLTRTLPAGGDAMARAVGLALEFNPIQAEEYKRTYGLLTDKLDGKIVAAVKPVMDTIVNEVSRAIAFYQEKYKDSLQSVVLSGGTARLPGMVTYLASAIGLEVQLANPWAGIARSPRFNVLTTEGPNFAVALGLALRVPG